MDTWDSKDQVSAASCGQPVKITKNWKCNDCLTCSHLAPQENSGYLIKKVKGKVQPCGTLRL